MFRKRRATRAQAQEDEQPTGLAEDPPGGERSVREEETPGEDALTLSTMCACGHIRKDHGGMRMEACGPCLVCDCDEFRPVNETLEKLRALLTQVERLQEIAGSLRGQMNDEGKPTSTSTLPNGTPTHSGPPDPTNAPPFRQARGRMGRLSALRPDQDDHA